MTKTRASPTPSIRGCGLSNAPSGVEDLDIAAHGGSLMRILKEVEIPFPFDAEVRLRGGRVRTWPLYGWANAVVPVVGDDEAPVVVRAKGVRMCWARSSQDIDWRAWRGYYWRPVLDDLGVPQLVGAEDFTCETPLSGQSFRWIDHPCGLRLGKRFVSGPDALGFWPCETAALVTGVNRIVGGNRGEVARLAMSVVADEMAEIGGVIHKRAALPMWSLGSGQELVGYGGEVSLVLPDFGERALPSLGLVPMTHPDLAKQMADGLVRFGGGDPCLVKSFDPSASVEVIGTVRADAAVFHTLLHAREMLNLVAGRKAYEAGPTVELALKRMFDSLDRLHEAHVAERPLDCILAVNAIGRAYDAMGNDVRPRRDLMALLRAPIRVADRCSDHLWGGHEEAGTPKPGR